MQATNDDWPTAAPDCVTANARVERVGQDRSVVLRVLDPPRCRGCEGACIWRLAPVSTLRLRSNGEFFPGQRVVISLKRNDFLRAALILHGLPWAGLVAGAALGALAFGGDPGTLAGAFMGLLGGLGTTRAVVSRRLDRPRWITPDLVMARES